MRSSSPDPLAAFSPRTRAWFEAAFAEPTPAQAMAWPAVAGGEHVLLSAPTGSGKTLAAFLWALDSLTARARAHARGEPAATNTPPPAQPPSPQPPSPHARAHARGEPAAEDMPPAQPPHPPSTERGTRLVYVSPLKALSYDIERNLRVPLRGIGAEVSVGIRTGDTPQRERAAMARKPPDILITTPESLYLILGSRARETLNTVECVIVDEIHAVASVKRGAHLALTLERLEWQAGRELQRIGLSATQSPLEEIGRFLVGPRRNVRILDTALRKPLDLRIHVPVESMAQPEPAAPRERPHDPLEPGPGGELTPERGIWPAIYPELLRLVREHRSTIVFVNNRRSAERVARRLNELAAAEGDGEGLDGAAPGGGPAGLREAPAGRVASADVARAHHGSLSREERTTVEELLKAGELPCLVATSSLELGIDMGAVDLVLQVESPKSVARGLQRIGRAGHGVGDVSKGRIFPKFRGDLLECAVVCRRMREGAIEPTVVPRNALDVLAQQIVAIAASAQDGVARGDATTDASGRGSSALTAGEHPEGGVSVEELYELVTRTHSYSDLPRSLLENVLDMLDGRYPSRELGELRPRIVWDRVAGRIRARRGARQLAIANAGTIPDRGLYLVTLPDGRRVGELDEEMVYEARPGQVFLLGASSWRIEEIGRDRVIVTPAPGVPGAVPFWKGEGVGRPRELGEAIGAFARWAVDRDERALVSDYDLDERAARNLIEYLREQQAATGVLPSDRTIVLERFRDEIGDWRLCVLSPHGGRVHAAWSLAISARIRELHGIDGEAIFSDDGIVVRLPDVDLDEDADRPAARADGRAAAFEEELSVHPSDAELVALDPQDVEELIVSELGGSALFGARFRENAGRALLIPRAYPGRRTPLWQQRLKAQSLLEVARRHPDFPIVLETYRECLRDVLDVPGLVEILRGLATRELSLVEVQTQSASPFASSLLFDYVASYMYEGDTPNAERRAAALSLDRDLLRELLGMEDLRELIDPGALAQVEDDLQHRSPRTRADTADALCEIFRRIGDLSRGEAAERVTAGLDPDAMLDALVRERRVVEVRVAGERRYVAADDAGLYRDALGVAPPGGLPGAFLADVPDALSALAARYARTHGPFTAAELRERYRVDASAALRELERSGEIVRGELRPSPPALSSTPPPGVSPQQRVSTSSDTPPPGVSHPRTPGWDGREWCDVDVLRRLRRASLAALRREIEPVCRRALAGFLPSWQGIDRHARPARPADEGGAPRDRAARDRMAEERSSAVGVERLREVIVPLQGLALPVHAWERDVLPRRTGAYSPAWLDSLCASGEVVWVGAGALGRDSGRVALYFREDAAAIGPPPGARIEPPQGPEHERLRARLAAGPCFFTDLLAELDMPAPVLAQALWDLVWAGEATNDAWAPLRASRHAFAHSSREGEAAMRGDGRGALRAVPMPVPAGRRRRAGTLRGGRASARGALQGRWSSTGSLFGGEVDAVRRRRTLAELLLERYGLVTREQVLAEGVPGGFSMLYGALCELETLGMCRRGYFVEGLGGAQFALPGAVERLRAAYTGAIVLAAIDPAQPYGATLPWPPREHGGRGPARVDGAYVVLVDSEPVLYLERGGRGLITLGLDVDGKRERALGDSPARERDGPLDRALRALAEAVRAGRVARVALERVDGEPVIGSALQARLVELGFHAGPRRLELRA